MHPPAHRLSIAPMLDWSDRHFRFFIRQITRHALLYSEMITTGALLHQSPERFLRYHPQEHPVALQLGGSEPGELARCARIVAAWGYDQLNLNVGCPSDRVQSGRFGACLMAEPQRVAACVAAMSDAVGVPITVKHRIGIDHLDSYPALCEFVACIAAAGCNTFIVHARKAWLQGLSPKENREIPPLNYPMVYQLKKDFPDLTIIINGGILHLEAASDHLAHVDGVMIGRGAYHTPWCLAEADRRLYGADHTPTREGVVAAMIDYIEQEFTNGTPLHHITRHLLGLYHGQPGARRWRSRLSELATHPTTTPQQIAKVLQREG